MRKATALFLSAALPLLAGGAGAQAQDWLKGIEVHDLSHVVPMFQAKDGDMLKADTTKAFKDSKPVSSFGFEGVRKLKDPFKTATGYFQWGYFTLDEHYSTHLDSTDHYQNSPLSRKVATPDNRSVDQYSAKELIGRIVFIDVSDRVAKELAKNGGKPDPDRNKTNFDNMLTAADIDKVKDQIDNGVWLVVNLGWSQFYEGLPPQNPFTHPYVNGLNFPGLGKEVVERLIAIEQEKGVRIAGIVADNLSIDSGRSGLGSKGDPFGDGWYVHQLGLQRGWKLVENATNLAALARYAAGQCALVVGAPKVVSATGVPARLFALCRPGG